MRKSNKILAVVLALVMMLTTVPMMTAMAAGEAEEHVHVFKVVDTPTEATCTTEGVTVYKCVTAGCTLPLFSIKTEKVAHMLVGSVKDNGNPEYHYQRCDTCDKLIPADHTFVDVEVTKEASCFEEGSKKVKCSVCNYEKTERIAKLAHDCEYVVTDDTHKAVCKVCTLSIDEKHDFSEEGTVKTAPKCNAPGVEVRTCTVCEKEKEFPLAETHTYGDWKSANDTQHEKECVCGQKDYANHKFVVVVGEKSKCDSSVALTITCEDCNYKLEVAAKEHNFNNVEKYDEKDHKQKCEECGLSVLAAHEWEDVKVNKEPTCGVPGSKDVKCKVCEETATIEIAVSDAHNVETWTEVTPATCSAVGTEKGTCKNCNKEITREIPKNDNHTVTTWTEVTAPTCKEVGSEKGTCTVCNEEVTRDIPKTEDHKWGNWTTVVAPSVLLPGTKIRTCDVCGKIERESIPKLDGEQEVLMGDVNGDGEITSFDARKALQAAVGNYELSEGEFARADMNGDKEITSMDARKILKLSVGLEA